jgi:hypothetical protein
VSERQPTLPIALVRAAQTQVTALGQRIPDQAAVAWVHSAALARHAQDVGLAATGGSVRAALEQVAEVHPALKCWIDSAANPLWDHPIDDAEESTLVAFWAGHPLPYGEHTRWWSYPIGDLYQALSTEARKGRALCQTPDFVTGLLLRVSYDRAVEHWHTPRVIDPACGTGHILLETFMHATGCRPYTRAGSCRQHCGPEQIATGLATVHGVDLDSYAVAIARYRLVVMAAAQVQSWRGRRDVKALADLPIQVAAADSLLAEDEPLLARGRYHVVVGNPPYITVKDAALNEAIRSRYPQVCHRKYSLALPFTQLMTELAVPGGWVAQLTTNSFMKREFGKKFVEDYLPRLDVQWVIDTSGAYIPGHGTPTVILVHRNQAPTGETVRTVLGVRGEPGAPDDPAKGLVWTAIRDAVEARESAERWGRMAAVPA